MNLFSDKKDKIEKILKIALNNLDNISNLKIKLENDVSDFIPFLLDDKFPVAINPSAIADPNSESDQTYRAKGILQQVVKEIVKGKFLDYGCGNGHVAVEAAYTAKVSVGYDIVDKRWSRFNTNAILTTSWEDVVKNGPYDIILIYDVLDHLKDENQAVEELKKIREILSGKLIIRCHPWCSRHGTHLYNSVNRAYLHLLLDEETLKDLGYEFLHTIKLIHPLNAYKSWFQEAGFEVVSHDIIAEEPEPFFYQPEIANIIKSHWKVSYDENLSSGRSFPSYQLRQQFVSWVLNKKENHE